jgi:hypothetical protein
VRVYHSTEHAEAILRDGFRDGTGSYGMHDTTLRGVFVADQPVGVGDGAKGEQVLAIDLPGDPEAYGGVELIEDRKGFREWCIPADRINEGARVRLLTEAEVDAIGDENFRRRHPDAEERHLPGG